MDKYKLKYDEYNEDEQDNHPYLDNKLGIVDKFEMLDVEYKVTSIKTLELYKKNIVQKIPMTFEGLCYIHKYLLEDLYPWAGKIRVMNMIKGSNTFYYVENINEGINDLFDSLKKDNYLKNLTPNEFVDLFAYYSNELNILHPFRECNGRSKRLFLTELARRAGYDLDLNKLDPEKLKQADIKAFGSIQDRLAPNFYELKVLYSTALEPIGEPFSTDNLTNIQLLSRTLWVYDREEYNNWQRKNHSMKTAEKKLEELMRSDKGREEIIYHIDCAMVGAKPKSVLKYLKDVKQELLSINNTKISKKEESRDL